MASWSNRGAGADCWRRSVRPAHRNRRKPGQDQSWVAPEWGWDRTTFLAHACRKAGLAADAWRHGAAVYRFEADVFGDD